MRSVDLEAVADALETAAGASTSANSNEIGRWKRIAAAAEALAGAGTTTNPNLMGFMKRTAVALENIAGTDGAEENANERGYMKRIVDALEVRADAVTVGSLENRMVTAAGDAKFIDLAALSLDDLTIAEDQPEGTKVGTITGATGGSTVTLHAQSDAGMFAKDGNDIEVGATPLDFETVPSPTITLRETHAGALNSPRDTVIEIEVTDVAEGPTDCVVDGGFDDPAQWSGPQFTVSESKGNFATTLTRTIFNVNGTTSVIGHTYRCTFTISNYSAGSVRMWMGVNGTLFNANGTYTEDLVAASTGIPRLVTNGATTLSVDDFSVIDLG